MDNEKMKIICKMMTIGLWLERLTRQDSRDLDSKVEMLDYLFLWFKGGVLKNLWYVMSWLVRDPVNVI